MNNTGIQISTTSLDASASCVAKHSGHARDLAPIALFVYNRPEHTHQTIEALRENGLAQQSDLFVFADGPKNEPGAATAVREVRKLIRTIDGFKSVTVIERERNLGLSKSVICGVTQLCNEYGRVIVVEDDVVTAPDFLTFVNQGLKRYEGEPRVFSIGAFNLPIVAPLSYSYDAFCSYRFLCWGWGTWKDRWEKADWLVKDFPEFMSDREKQKRFNLGGDDLSWLLTLQMEGKIDSWDTIWAYTHSKHEALALLSVVSKAYNIGFDGTGIHCRRAPFKQNALSSSGDDNYRFPDSIFPEPHFAKEIQRFQRPSIARRLVRFFRRFELRMKRFDTATAPKGEA
jgi:Glycosyl transferase family 2